MPKAAPERQYVRLSFRDGEVVVTPKDYDIFTISAERAIEACRDLVSREEYIQRVERELLVPLYEWAVPRVAKVRACYIPRPMRQIQVFVVTRSPKFDYALAEEVAALEFRLSRAGWRIGVLQLPDAGEDSLSTFFDPKGALEIHADGEPTPGEGSE